MIRKWPCTIALIFSLSPGGFSASLYADTLTIPGPHSRNSDIPRPIRAMTMAEVEQQYGQPVKKHSAVGKPPITRWEYKEYTVTFEGEYVIHSVVRRNK